MNVTDKIINDMSKRMADQIDEELMDDIAIAILINDGWTETNLNPAFPEYGMLTRPFEDWYSITAEWVHKNAQGEYKLVKGQWLFKNPKDATMFILKWS
jgi:hypothetical protein